MKIQTIRYAGHSSVFFEGAGTVAVIDPWLEGNPSCPDALKNPQRMDLIVLTHGHADHAGEAARWAKQHGAMVVATWELCALLGRDGVPERQLIAMNKGGTIEHGGLSVTLTHAFHSSSYDTAAGTFYAGEPAGVVLRDGQTSIYHAGDTALFSDMRLIAEMYRPRVALLPIGDRFTMGPVEAAKAVDLIRPEIVIPVHWGTFDMLTGTPEQFTKACAGKDVRVQLLRPGEEFSF